MFARYYKNESMKELDEFLGDIKLSIQDIEVVYWSLLDWRLSRNATTDLVLNQINRSLCSTGSRQNA